MPEEIKELTDCQTRLLNLLFLPENREALRSGDWGDLTIQAGYSEGTAKFTILQSKLFREKLESVLSDYHTSLQVQAIMVSEDILSGFNKTPNAPTQLSAAKDVLDRSKRFVKRTETKVDSDTQAAIIFLPQKEDIDE